MTPQGDAPKLAAVTLGPYCCRDRVARWLANAALRLASRRYRAMVGGLILYGMDAAARDEREHLPAPPRWFAHDDATPGRPQ